MLSAVAWVISIAKSSASWSSVPRPSSSTTHAGGSAVSPCWTPSRFPQMDPVESLSPEWLTASSSPCARPRRPARSRRRSPAPPRPSSPPPATPPAPATAAPGGPRPAPGAARRSSPRGRGRPPAAPGPAARRPSSASPRASAVHDDREGARREVAAGVAVGLGRALHRELEDQLRLPADQQSEGRRAHHRAAALGLGVLRLVQRAHPVVAQSDQARAARGPAGVEPLLAGQPADVLAALVRPPVAPGWPPSAGTRGARRSAGARRRCRAAPGRVSGPRR